MLTGRTFTDDLNEDDKYVVNKTDWTYADQLCVMDDVTLADYENLYNYAAIHTNYGKTKIVTVADEAEARALIHDAVYVSGNNITTTNDKVWYSVMDVKGTSYWTGKVADKVRDDKVYTAEELAYDVQNGNNITLTHNIDLGYGGNRGSKDLPVTGFANSKEDVAWVTGEQAIEAVDGAGKTISRATVTKGLFGAEATTVKDLTVGGVFVDGAYLLAKTGTAQNVTATGLNYSRAKAEGNVLAGLFYEADIETAALTKECTVTLNPDAKVAEHKYFGKIYGVLGVDLGQIYKIAAAGDDYGVFNCYANDGDDHESHTGITRIVFTKYTNRDELPQAPELVKWDTSKGEISDKHTVYFLTPAEGELPESKLNTSNYLIYDGSKTDAGSIQDAAKEGGDVTFGDDVTVASEEVVQGNYGGTKAGIYQGGDGTINGNGYELIVEGPKAIGIMTAGGTIENLSVNAYRGIYITYPKNSVTIDGCTLAGGYAINVAGDGFGKDATDTDKMTLSVNKTEIIGWSSWTLFKTASFTDCTFTKGSYWTKETSDAEDWPERDNYNHAFRVYTSATTFKNCDFEKGWRIYLNTGSLTFDNCRVGGETVTKDNVEKLFEVVKDTKATTGKDAATYGTITVK